MIGIICKLLGVSISWRRFEIPRRAFLYAICYHGPKVSCGILRETIGRCTDKSERIACRSPIRKQRDWKCARMHQAHLQDTPINALGKSGQVYSLRLIFDLIVFCFCAEENLGSVRNRKASSYTINSGIIVNVNVKLVLKSNEINLPATCKC